MFVDQKEGLAFLLSGLTIVLFIIAIIAFIKYGGHLAFYVSAIGAFAVGILNAWVISKMPEHVTMGPRREQRRRRTKRKRSR